jgi:hypothetical protein
MGVLNSEHVLRFGMARRVGRRLRFGENSLMRHGNGCILGVLRLYLTPSSFGVAQDDKERRCGLTRVREWCSDNKKGRIPRPF